MTLCVALALPTHVAASERFDVVIINGTVVDPETHFHEIANVGIRGDTIVVVSHDVLDGDMVLDAAGLVVAPGFIDLCSYEPYRYSSRFKVADGVTTALGLHGGTSRFDNWAEKQRRAQPMVNYGAAFSHRYMRGNIGVRNRYKAADEDGIATMVRRAENSIAAGALGISFSLEYTPGASTDEIRPLFEVAGRLGVPTFHHLRYSDPEPPGTNEEAVDEVITLARETGASVHIHHLTSTGGTFTMPATVKQIEAAHAEGLDVTANIYPYHFWGTYLRSARFDPGWQERFRISYEDLELAGRRMPITEKNFAQLRKTARIAIAYAIPEEDVHTALTTPWIVVASDTVTSRSGISHPRGAGCYARVLGKYVCDEAVLDLEDALAKMSLEPARILEHIAPALRRKGRLRAGMDADIVVFDAERVRDLATVDEPRQFSAGIHYVLVNGVLVRDRDKVFYRPAGKLIRSELAPAAAANSTP